MIRVAAGEKLPFKQSDVKLTGWAVESRVYAEDPFRNFLPSIGRLVKYRPPAEGTTDGITVRNDTGVEEGGEISMFYDPMIAKLVTHGPTRDAAIDAQADGPRCLLHRRHPAQHPVPDRPHAASALARRASCRPGSSPRSIPRASSRARPKGEELKIADGGRRHHRPPEQSAPARDHPSDDGPAGALRHRRVVKVGKPQRRRRGRRATATRPVSPSWMTPASRRGRFEIASDWWPGDPVWRGTRRRQDGCRAGPPASSTA